MTLEPVILGLLVAPSAAGWVLGAVTLLAFLVRTPLKVVLVDRWRRRWLPRTRTALSATLVELIAIGALILVALSLSHDPFWWPVMVAVPLVAVGLWYDMRSRSRHLVAEVAGVLGIAAAAPVVALAGGVTNEVAVGVWLVVASRSVAAVGLVRVALKRAKEQEHRRWHADLAQAVAVAAGAVGVIAGLIPWPALVVLGAGAASGVVTTRLPPVAAYVVGAQQVVVGLTVILVSGLAFRAW